MKCLTNADVNDTYTLALMNYAFSLYGVESEMRTSVKKKLISRAIEHGKNWRYTNSKNKYFFFIVLDMKISYYALLY